VPVTAETRTDRSAAGPHTVESIPNQHTGGDDAPALLVYSSTGGQSAELRSNLLVTGRQLVDMVTVKVKPLPDGTSMRGNWQVVKSGRRVSKHTKKSAAKRRAYREASAGDKMVIMRLNGTVQDQRRVA